MDPYWKSRLISRRRFSAGLAGVLAAGPLLDTLALAQTPPSPPTNLRIAHGALITPANTGHTAYFDPTLGRFVTDADLTVHSGSVSLSGLGIPAGGTISKRWFQGGLTIDRSNVTILASRFNNEVWDAGLPFTLEWCTVSIPGAPQDIAVAHDNYTVYRCNLSGCSDGLRINGNVVATECYITVKGQSSADHNDGCQNFAGNGPVTVERCWIDARPTNGIGAANAALFAADGANGLMTWNDNYVAGGGYVIRCYENCTYVVQGNWVEEGSWQFAPAHRAVIPASNVAWGTVRPNYRVQPVTFAVVSTIPAP